MIELVTIDSVCQQVHMHRATIYKHILLNKFPKPIKTTGKSSRWVQSEIDAWIEQLMAARGTS